MAKKRQQRDKPKGAKSFQEANARGAVDALEWLIRLCDFWRTSPLSPGTKPRGRIVDGTFVKSRLRDEIARMNACELRSYAEAIRVNHQAEHLPELPSPMDGPDEDVWLLSQWARTALAKPTGATDAHRALSSWPQLDDEAYSILTTLADSPTRLKVIEFGGDRRTISKHLTTLAGLGFVDYKPQAKKGAGITDKGRHFLERKT